MTEPFERLAQARRGAGHLTPTDAARAFGWNEVTYRAHENGVRGLRQDAIERYARAFRVTPAWIAFGEGAPPVATSLAVEREARQPRPLQVVPIPDNHSREMLPVYGRGTGGPDGRFILNGEIIDRIAAPPGLIGAKGAYALYVDGSSMEPRYFEGEAVYVHPGKPVRQGDHVVIQIRPDQDGDPVEGLIKKLISKSAIKVVTEQYNPPMRIEFNAAEVMAIHRIVLGGEG